MSGTEEEMEPFACPRCRATISERFWGPCRSCRAQLVDAYAATTDGDGGPSTSGRFEPSMHVVPNHVATKD
ncbi:MAG TPA: hypothetical protein VG435_03495 [Acidimicrobiales bacterium]|jgi:hypothetical protein|nr:hypothetical protein [Acidimicrobiales bacterium]